MTISINVKEMNPIIAQEKAKLAEQIVNNMSFEALKILAEKSEKKGMSEKLIKFKNMI
jgi:hypothetical protein